ncbi:hypothetical protein XELAEV_18002927mg [Xenopus laevis]|nr:hypothetical protein XELAEV_18002927mg [Xenopus laevis]
MVISVMRVCRIIVLGNMQGGLGGQSNDSGGIVVITVARNKEEEDSWRQWRKERRQERLGRGRQQDQPSTSAAALTVREEGRSSSTSSAVHPVQEEGRSSSGMVGALGELKLQSNVLVNRELESDTSDSETEGGKMLALIKRYFKDEKEKKDKSGDSVRERGQLVPVGAADTYACALTETAAHLPRKLRRAIEAGRFVDVYDLTREAVQAKEDGVKIEGDGRKNKSIFEWLKGFLVFASIYLEKKPEQCLNVINEVYKNVKSASQHEEALKQKLEKELKAGRMAGPFEEVPIKDLVVSPLGIVPKKEPGKFRMIQHLSYPEGASVNDALDKEQCSIQYQSFEKALETVKMQGEGALIAKVDIESAFRLLPLHPDSFKLTGCYFQGVFYVDMCLPMGCRGIGQRRQSK